jgi:hypothetical protein
MNGSGKMDKKLIVLVSLLIVMGLVLPTAVVNAKKPDKPPGGGGGGDDPTPTGTIYYTYNDGTGKALWKMDADGKPKAEVCTFSSTMQSMSRKAHGGNFWFLGFKVISGESYPDGIQRQEVYAIRDDNSKEVQLTFDSTLASSYDSDVPVWGVNDGYISWIAKRWVQTGSDWTLGKCGVWKQSIAFDSNGDVTGLTGSPGLTMWTTKPEILIGDTTSGTSTSIAEGYHPTWSPDGNKVAFTQGGSSVHLKVINVDGTGEKSLAQATHAGGWTYQIDSLDWSTDNEFLTYVLSKYTVRKTVVYRGDIYYVGADGNGNTCLSKDLTQGTPKTVMGWR